MSLSHVIPNQAKNGSHLGGSWKKEGRKKDGRKKEERQKGETSYPRVPFLFRADNPLATMQEQVIETLSATDGLLIVTIATICINDYTCGKKRLVMNGVL